MTTRLTATGLNAAWRGSDHWLTDVGVRGGGRLAARVTRNAVLFYFRYRVNGQNRALPLGQYDERGSEGLTLKDARKAAAPLADLLREGVTDLHGHLRREQQARERAALAAEEKARREALAANRGTLAQLCDAYAEHLKRQGKQAHGDVTSLFKLHVIEADPELAARRATDVSTEDFSGLLARLIDADKGRTAAKLRAYLRAAYTLALQSHTDPAAPLGMRAFGISANPLASIPALARFSRARDRVLNAPELTALHQRLEALPAGPIRDALLAALYLGGQRPAQLLRVRAADVDLPGATIMLRDPKGKRHEPRRHPLPLFGEVAAIVGRNLTGLEGDERLFHTRPETLSGVVAELSRAMVSAGEARATFQLRDIRRTCETMLASLAVSSDVRAQLQSHGLGGVQNRHYDRHDYMAEKKRALELWVTHLRRLKEGERDNVVPMARPAPRA
jgi:integrase